MLKDGEKGAVLQRDKATYAIVPHLPLGMITPDQLRKIADVADKFEAAALKITSAARIAIIGLKEEDVDRAWLELDMDPGAAVGMCVRSIKACPGTSVCRLGQQDALALGKELDEKYHGYKVPSKFKIGVSGCPNQCAESTIKDLGFIGRKKGWTIVVGGNAASKPRLAEILASDLTTEQALTVADTIFAYYRKMGKKGERLGKFIDRTGFHTFRNSVLA